MRLEQEIDPFYSRIEHRWQVVSWIFMAAILLLAIGGLFGGGLLSTASVTRTGENYEIELAYERFGRMLNTMELSLVVRAPQQTASDLSVVLDGDLREKVTFTRITPQPDSESIDGNQTVFSWQVEGWNEPLLIDFEYEAREWRGLDGRIAIRAGEQELGELRFDQFLFP